LFVPFGVALGATGRGALLGLAIGLAASLGIELAQFSIPDRYPTLGDVLYNGFGTSAGVTLHAWRRHLLRPDLRAARRLTVAWCTLGIALVLGTPLALAPQLTEGGWSARWTPDLAYLGTYAGEVIEASIDTIPLRDGALAASASVRRALLDGARIEVAFVAGRAPERLSPILGLFDGAERELFLIGVDDRDLVIRYRTEGLGLRLGRPDFRVPDATSRWMVGDTVRLTVAAIRHGVRVRVGGARPRGSAAPAGGPPTSPDWEILRIPSARAWALLMYPDRLARRRGQWLDLAWMALLALPLGLWVAPKWLPLAASAWMAALLIVPGVAVILSPSGWGCAGVAAGAFAGLAARMWLRRGAPTRA